MERKTFKISINGIEVAKKYSFNTARREIPNQIKKIISVGETWNFIEEKQNFDGPFRIGTTQIWSNEKDEKITAVVEQVK